ncbi:tRNA (N6-isopentenyl adenosine(37)-C2)-methylthiotransferase MiaB [bacterium]|nr:tRNA (N6-isopentenyl adenosine(37)-C2)-methylthiotransferase MiaB [bacterium]MBU1782728.1 tRNA (N6-isopentenyl adenosine(37)-C2)-methylthiotransferase MiaB [bacterium]
MPNQESKKSYEFFAPKVFIQTFGCQMNIYDSQVILERAMRIGYQEVETETKADLIILNTCSIRAHAEEKVFSKLGWLKKLKQEKKDLIIGICGCMAQHYRKTLFEKYNFLDFIVNSSNIDKLPTIIKQVKEGETNITCLGNFKNSLEKINPYRKDKIFAYLPIIFGCDNFCSYCVVPFLRGKSRSRNLEEIVKEAEDLSQQGCQEITLVGQNVNSYGRDLNNKTISFSALLRKLNSIEGIKRVRFITSHPKDVSDDLLDCLVSLPKICKHIHLPVQSGSDKILDLMKRGYTAEKYLHLVDKLRKKVENISITTDFMVGFPGETKKDFEDTLNLARKVKFDKAFTFKFSPRKNTPAYKMKDQVEEEVLKRLQMLIAFQNEISKKKNEEYLGRIQEVLVEGESSKYKDRLCGKTNTFKMVLFNGEKSLIGRLIKVKITNCNMRTLEGRVVDD